MLLSATARLLKARHERHRSRTRERALLAFSQLCECLAAPTSSSSAASSSATAASAAGTWSRTPLCFSVWFPLHTALRKEAAEVYITMGLIGERMGGDGRPVPYPPHGRSLLALAACRAMI